MLKTAINIEITMKPTTRPMIRIIAGSSKPGEALDVVADLAVEEVGGGQQHLVELAGVLADRDHLQRELREHAAAPERPGHAGAFADADLHLVSACAIT